MIVMQSSMTKYLLFSGLAKKKMHGYELITQLGITTGKKPSASQIYPVLKQMKRLGYVSVSEKTDGKKKLKYYRITSSGRQFFNAMSKRFESMMIAALKSKIKVCSHCSCEILNGAVRKLISGKTHYFCCTSCAASFR